jgi:xylulokinase
MEFLLGIDVGTTATKALLFDAEGNVIASASYTYGLITPHEGWVEQDPEELWRGVVQTSRSVVEQIDPGGRIVALSLSSQAGTTIPVAADGRPTYNAISWMDERAVEHARYVKENCGEDFIHATTGWPLLSGLPLQHIGWFRRNRPQEFTATRYFLFVNDFIGQRLAGRRCMNPSDASITQLMNVATGDWDERLLGIVRITRDQLSPIYPSGHVVGELTATASEATGLPQDLLVVNGAHDQYCAALATGVTQPGLVMLSCGTAWVILAVPESLEVGLHSGMAVSCHAVKGRWGAIRSLGGAGTSLEWLLDTVWCGERTAQRREDLYRAVNEEVAHSSPGAGGLLFYPLAGGHATTIGTGHGGFVGLSLSHSRADMARAVMEGITFELRWAMEEICQAGVEINELRMVGGAAKSIVWPGIVADITNVPVAVAAMRDAASYGAAILAGVGAGLFPGPEAATFIPRGQETHLEPTLERRPHYDRLYARYQDAWEAVTGTARAVSE